MSNIAELLNNGTPGLVYAGRTTPGCKTSQKAKQESAVHQRLQGIVRQTPSLPGLYRGT